MIGILTEDSGIRKIREYRIIAAEDIFLKDVEYGPPECLIVPVEGSVKSDRELMGIIYHILIQEISIGRMLTGIIGLGAEG